MKRLLRKSILLFTLIITFSFLACGQGGYRINIKAGGISNSTVKLAFHLGKQQYIKDSIVTDVKGQCRFSGNKPLPAGVYILVLPGKKFVEFLVEKDQYFTIACDTLEIETSLKIEGSELNQSFLDYQRGWKSLQDKAISLQSGMKAKSNNKDEYTKLRKAYSEHEELMKSWLASQAESNNGTLLGSIIKSIIPVPVVVSDLPSYTPNQDSIRKLMSYLYYKKHFFDNTDLNNPGLIRTPVLETKLEQFFTQVVAQFPDSVIKEADIVIRKCEPQKEVYQYVTSWIFNKYTTSSYMGHDAIVVHLADSIYLSGKAPWVSDEYLADLSKRIKRLKPNLIGSRAADLIMTSFTGEYIALSDITADFTILYFWEPDCGHCKESTPLLKEYYDKNKGSGIEVFAVCTKDDKEKWEKSIIDHNLNWINGWDPGRLSHFDYYYNVESTPMIYILDKDKKIIAKRLSVSDIGPFIESYRNYQRSKSTTSPR